MKKKIPIIGITKKFFSNKTLSLDFMAKNINNQEFLSKILPKNQIEVKSASEDSIQLIYKKPLNYQIISELKIEIDLKIEQLIPDEISPLIWKFSTKNHSHFYDFSGRIRVKRIGEYLKIGIYIYEMKIKNEKSLNFGLRAMKKITKDIILQIFHNLTQIK
ncbi:MAG: hypothetical protein ACTSXK_17170 [Promethearchaeota archaeon]